MLLWLSVVLAHGPFQLRASNSASNLSHAWNLSDLSCHISLVLPARESLPRFRAQVIRLASRVISPVSVHTPLSYLKSSFAESHKICTGSRDAVLGVLGVASSASYSVCMIVLLIVCHCSYRLCVCLVYLRVYEGSFRMHCAISKVTGARNALVIRTFISIHGETSRTAGSLRAVLSTGVPRPHCHCRAPRMYVVQPNLCSESKTNPRI